VVRVSATPELLATFFSVGDYCAKINEVNVNVDCEITCISVVFSLRQAWADERRYVGHDTISPDGHDTARPSRAIA